MKSVRIWGWLLLALWLTGCNGWDDDTQYAVETRASFFLAPSGAGLSLIELRNGNADAHLNELFGIENSSLSAVSMENNMLWLAAGDRQRLIAVDPESKSVLEEFTGLPLNPHYFAVGREQVVVTDTAAEEVAFIRLRNGEVTLLEFEGKPGRAIYSNGRFYTQVDDSLVDVLDEKAFTSRARLNIGASISEFQLDRFKNIYVLSQRDSIRYGAFIASNADYISRERFEVSYDKVRYTPYFARRYTTEYLTDLQLVDGLIQTPTATPVLDANAANFEVNFFGGVLFHFRNDSLFRYNLNTETAIDSMPFPFQVLNAWHQLSALTE